MKTLAFVLRNSILKEEKLLAGKRLRGASQRKKKRAY